MMFKMKSMPRAILYAIASGALSTAVVHPAMAQQVAADTMPAPQRVVVTGSNISRADQETPSPVQVITADDMKKSGYTSVSDVLRDITANGQGTLSQSFSGAFAKGASGVALRGLTVGATLVLIDGHRMAPYPLSDDGQRSFVDISNIPFDAVERIDIVKDGASAVYGSDAIAGVVNVILKKSYVGTNVTTEMGTSYNGGGTSQHAAVTHGVGDLEADGYNAYISAEYRHTDPIRLSQRAGQPWTNGDWTSRGGININPGVPNISNAGLTGANTPFLYNPKGSGGANNAANFAFAPGCDFTSYKAGQCAINDPYTELQPETQNINLLASVTKKLGGDWQINVKASALDSKDTVVTGLPTRFPSGNYLGNTALGPGVTIGQVGVIPSFLVPATYPGNTLGVPARVYGMVPGVGPGMDGVDSKSYRVVAEVGGTWNGWDVNAAAGYTKIVTDQTFYNVVDYTALNSALNNPTNPFLITGGNSAATMAAIAQTVTGQTSDELDFVEARASHEVMQLGGGAMSFSGGLSFVHRKLDAPDPTLFANGTLAGTTSFAVGQQNDAAGYVELYAPVLKTLEFDAAARLDHYDTYGNSSTPKVGFKYTPMQQIAFRGTLSKGFRAPGPAESGVAGKRFFNGAVNDPILCSNGNPTAAGNVISACNMRPAYVQTTSATLQPEKSTSATFGLMLEPIKGWSTTVDYYNITIKDMIVTAMSVPSFVPNYVRGAPVPEVMSDGHGGTVIGTPAVGDILYTLTGYVNANSTKTSGVDVETSYRFKLGEYGSLKTGFQITHLMSYVLTANGIAYQLAGTHGPSGTGGDTGNPKNRAQVNLSYDKGAFNATTIMNWVGKYDTSDPSVGRTTCTAGINSIYSRFPNVAVPPQQYCTVASFMSTDLTLSYKVGKNWTLHGTVLNLFNRAPPTDVATFGAPGGGVAAYNPAMAQAGAVGRFFNLGASYKF